MNKVELKKSNKIYPINNQVTIAGGATTTMQETGSEIRSVFDILRERMGMPPIEYVVAPPQESKSWSRQIVAALRRHWLTISRTSFGGANYTINQRRGTT